MNLIHTLSSWDTNLFLLVNGSHNSFFDGFMFAFSNKLVWIPLYIAVLYIVIKTWKKDSIWVILAFIVCIVIADQVSSGIIKDLVKRLRPSHAEHLKGLVHLVKEYSGGKYGFVSSHAANSFGFALLSSLLFKRRFFTILIFSWAIITAYSRIYLGVHYPLDVLGGTIVGIFAALVCFWALTKYRPVVFKSETSTNQPLVNIPIIVLGISFLGIIGYSIFF